MQHSLFSRTQSRPRLKTQPKQIPLSSDIIKDLIFPILLNLSYQYKTKHKYLYIVIFMQYSNKESPLTDPNLETDEYTFILKKMVYNYRVPEVSVNFPIVSRSPNLKITQEPDPQTVAMNSYPVFNNDSKYFTPCFVVDADKFKVQKSSEFYLEYHLKRVDEVLEDKSQILMPKPSKNHSTCSLCKISYEDYLQHIGSQGHLARVKKSKIGKNVDDLCKFMQKGEKRRERKQKKAQRQMKLKQKQIQKQSRKQAKLKKQKQNGRQPYFSIKLPQLEMIQQQNI